MENYISMSKKDYSEYGDILLSFKAHQCFTSVATNSIKLHINERKPYSSYIWIDPPWYFMKDDIVITSASDCPYYEEESYKQLFSDWLANFEPIFSTIIKSINYSKDNDLTIRLDKDYSLFIPNTNYEPDEESWYDHWYCSVKKID